jgi:dGTPase
MAELSPYAISESSSRGRHHREPPPNLRSEFQRDRDRIVHSTAFRRLEYKTQVFVNHEGDLFRTRLTHSIEVAQIARAIARALRLNEDAVEAIALAHDLGHTPFGHAGQEALDHCMREHGGFEHNLQSLRIVDRLENRYAEFPGLNLCFETREGIVKHCALDKAERIGDVGKRFLESRRPSLEAQLCNLADEIAYNNHDVDDGIRAGLIGIDQLESVPLFARHLTSVREAYPDLRDRRLVHETIRRMINELVSDLVTTTAARIRNANPASLEDIRGCAPLVAFSEETWSAHRNLKRFLHQNLYRHYRVLRMTNKAQRVVKDLFQAFIGDPRLLPPQYQNPDNQPRSVADYVSGMTDRYALAEHRRLFSVAEN